MFVRSGLARLFALVIPLGVVLVPAPTSTAPRGPRFGRKPHPGRVEHIHPGANGEIVFHHDPRIYQGLDSEQLRLKTTAVDAAGWDTDKYGPHPVRGGDGSGYYEGISQPKYQHSRYDGYRNVDYWHNYATSSRYRNGGGYSVCVPPTSLVFLTAAVAALLFTRNGA